MNLVIEKQHEQHVYVFWMRWAVILPECWNCSRGCDGLQASVRSATSDTRQNRDNILLRYMQTLHNLAHKACHGVYYTHAFFVSSAQQ